MRDIGQNLEQLNSEGSLRSFITAVKNATRSTLRRIGFDVIRYNPQTTHEAALARLLAVREIDTVLDIGANEGQYATMVRRAGFRRVQLAKVLLSWGQFAGGRDLAKLPPPWDWFFQAER